MRAVRSPDTWVQSLGQMVESQMTRFQRYIDVIHVCHFFTIRKKIKSFTLKKRS